MAKEQGRMLVPVSCLLVICQSGCWVWNFCYVSLSYTCGSGSRNVPYDWINKQKSNQNWLRKEGEKFLFPGGGTMFPRGVSEYVDSMQKLIPEMTDGTVRTAIDTGCGVSIRFVSLYVSGFYHSWLGHFWVNAGFHSVLPFRMLLEFA